MQEGDGNSCSTFTPTNEICVQNLLFFIYIVGKLRKILDVAWCKYSSKATDPFKVMSGFTRCKKLQDNIMHSPRTRARSQPRCRR